MHAAYPNEITWKNENHQVEVVNRGSLGHIPSENDNL